RTLFLFLKQAFDPFVLCCYAHCYIDNQDTEVGAANAPFRAHHAENFNRTGMFSASADSCGVDKEKFLTIVLVRNVDGVTCSSRQLAHNGAIAAHNRINQRRFAHIRPANDRYRNRMLEARGWMLNASGCWQKSINCFEQFGDSAIVLGANGLTAGESESRKISGQVLVFFSVDLFYAKDARLSFFEPQYG